MPTPDPPNLWSVPEPDPDRHMPDDLPAEAPEPDESDEPDELADLAEFIAELRAAMQPDSQLQDHVDEWMDHADDRV
jgi:hypothetical protein